MQQFYDLITRDNNKNITTREQIGNKPEGDFPQGIGQFPHDRRSQNGETRQKG